MNKSIKNYKDAMNKIKISDNYLHSTEAVLKEALQNESCTKITQSPSRRIQKIVITSGIGAAACITAVLTLNGTLIQNNSDIVSTDTVYVTETKTEVSEPADEAVYFEPDKHDNEIEDLAEKVDADYLDELSADDTDKTATSQSTAENGTADDNIKDTDTSTSPSETAPVVQGIMTTTTVTEENSQEEEAAVSGLYTGVTEEIPELENDDAIKSEDTSVNENISEYGTAPTISEYDAGVSEEIPEPEDTPVNENTSEYDSGPTIDNYANDIATEEKFTEAESEYDMDDTVSVDKSSDSGTPFLGGIKYTDTTTEIRSDAKTEKTYVSLSDADEEKILSAIEETLASGSIYKSSENFTRYFTISIKKADKILYDIHLTNKDVIILTAHKGSKTEITEYNIPAADYASLEKTIYLKFGSESDYQAFLALKSGK